MKPYIAFKTLIVANDLVINWAQLISLSLNICLCYDLIQILQSPFSVTRGRLKFYVSVSLLIATVAVIFIFFKQDRHQWDNFYEQQFQLRVDRPDSNLILAMSFSVYILIALNSWIFSCRRLNRPGVSKEVRQQFQKKHTTYVVMFIIIWTI